MPEKILVVDDDKDMCLLLNRLLTRKGYEVFSCNSGAAAISWLLKNKPDVALCDFRLDDLTGAELLKKIKEQYREVPVVIITGYSDVKNAVEVMKMGAFDYVTKPLLPDEILATIRSALSCSSNNELNVRSPNDADNESTQTSSINGKSKTTDKASKSWNNSQYILGDSEAFAKIVKQIELVAPTNFSVIIYGESGSGKEAIAQQIHKNSKRASKPFIAIDCGALSKELAASELFGHEKGSFTGALNQKIGSMELANGGTIFLDEIGNLGYDIQVSLLRVVQERKIRRVGGNRDISLDVRILVASNEKLWESARKGKFREDLFHRFNEFSIEVPPLRARTGDMMLFANHFLAVTNAELEKNVKGFSKEVAEIFEAYPWYGNLRELKNVVKRATLLTDGNRIEAKSLPFEIAHFQKLLFNEDNDEDGDGEDATGNGKFENKLKNANIDAEYEVILGALKEADYNKSKAAKLLNIDRKTLYYKMKQFQEFKLD